MELKDILKAKGLTDEQIAEVETEMKENKLYITGEENIDIRYNKLKEQSGAHEEELQKAKELIEELKKNAGNAEETEKKITEYEAEIETLKDKLLTTQTENALREALRDAHGNDIDYLVFKVKEKGEIKLNEDGKIADIDRKIETLKAELPQQFESAENGNGRQFKPIEDAPNADGKEGSAITPEEFQKMNYKKRAELYREHPETYHELTKKEE